MNRFSLSRIAVTASAALLALAFLAGSITPANAQAEAKFLVAGRLIDAQGVPVVDGHVTLGAPGDEAEPLGETESAPDGSWLIWLDEVPEGELELNISRPHFESVSAELDLSAAAPDSDTSVISHGETVMVRRVTVAFWIATAIFLLVLILIALEILHSTTAALVGISLVFVSSALGVIAFPDLYIFDLERALTYINWEVIFLVMAMMIIIAVIEGTGIFQWTTFQAYRLSRGRSWLLVLILMLVTAVASALLDNFTTMLLMTPISLQIGLALGINPLALIIPEILASNIGGISTLIGTPTNILIGAHAGIGFNDFLANQTVGVVIALMASGLYVIFHFRIEWKKTGSGISETLYETLQKNARIRDREALWKSGVVFLAVLLGFIFGEKYHIVPAVPALVGAAWLLVWLKPDIHKMIGHVDWTTLVFFMALFMVVGAVQEVGMISLIADGISQLVGTNLNLAIFVMVIGVGLLSMVIANIPLAASMLPVVDFLSGSIPGANGKALYYALSMGSAMGGNGTLVGGEANLVTAGITSQAGLRITFKEFFKVGVPVTLITLVIGYVWLVIRF